jgi:hypothetical protein
MCMRARRQQTDFHLAVPCICCSFTYEFCVLVVLNWCQVIEALDHDHQCVEYWNHKHITPVTLDNNIDAHKYSLRLSCSIGDTEGKDFDIKLTKQEQYNPSEGRGHESMDEEVQKLRGLLEKASPEELRMMHRALCSESQNAEWRMALTSLIEEIQKSSCR